MKIFQSIQLLRDHLAKLRKQDLSIGLVPTMGALHEGHLSLIAQANEDCDQVVCSIFVNPRQFNNSKDLERYPRTLENDLKLLSDKGCHIAFCPPDNEVYKTPTTLSMNLGRLENIMEGKFRPNHFSGVGLIVSKLFNIVQPTKAYFGLKDYQQFIIVKKIVEDLSLDICIEGVPTLRDPDGLAMSSRNQNLTKKERQQAPIFYKALNKASIELKNDRSIEETKRFIEELFTGREPSLEYFEIANSFDLSPPLENSKESLVLCIAGYVGRTRLIDNILID